jgi:hypothetical protein
VIRQSSGRDCSAHGDSRTGYGSERLSTAAASENSNVSWGAVIYAADFYILVIRDQHQNVGTTTTITCFCLGIPRRAGHNDDATSQ